MKRWEGADRMKMQRCRRDLSLHHPHPEENSPCRSNLQTASTEWRGGGNTFLLRTYNVLEPTSTNTTSTSAWSLRNSRMQYITLTLPCLDSGLQGPERGTWHGMVGMGQGQRSRSPNPTVVCKKREMQRCISNCSYVMKWQRTRGVKKTPQAAWNDHLILQK